MTNQVLHLFLQACHGLPTPHGKHKRVHVLIIQSHFNLLWIRKKKTNRNIVLNIHLRHYL